MDPNRPQNCNPFDFNAPIPRLKKQIPRIPKRPKPEENSKIKVGSPAKKKDKVKLAMSIRRPIPFQKKIKSSSFSSESSGTSRVSLISEVPFVLKVNTKGIPIRYLDATKLRTSGRSGKRKSYTEKETDSDFLETDSEDDAQHQKKKTKRLSKGIKKSPPAVASANVGQSVSSSGSNVKSIDEENFVANEALPTGNNHIEAPPPGVLPSLWYSREGVFQKVWVIEKIIGWKMRSKFEIRYKDDAPVNQLDKDIAVKIQDKLINHYISNGGKRMDVSRISPRRCPEVSKAWVEKEEQAAKKEGRDPRFCADKTINEGSEEVLLIKWRGRSYLHCSWERTIDLERLDPTNNTAKGKIKRYYQTQYSALGSGWRKILTDGRKAAAGGHGHGLQAIQGETSFLKDDGDITDDAEFFPPDNLEVERILACDESDMDLDLFARQRALNMRNEKEREECRREELLGGVHHLSRPCLGNVEGDKEEPWDPEDYVRYIVKWKGLPLSEVTWEYWLHIKHDCVDHADDFWRRQKPTDADMSAEKNHPHMREYKKLTESPVFGFSATKRTVAKLHDGQDDAFKNGDDEESQTPLRLRSYQLEGVNWLLWNWWNRRSCILADEMGLGKTIQSISFLNMLQKLPATNVRGPFLIVAPLSLVNQWQSEARTWAPDMNILLYHGSMDARAFLMKQEFYYLDQFVPKPLAQQLKRAHVTKFHALITTYEVVMKDVHVLSKIRWKALIVDEAHRLKNDQSRLFRDLANVPRDFCLLLTGTPLQNSTEELWSLLNFSDKMFFSSKESFTEKFGQLSDATQVSDLHSILKPYLLRRVKEDVEKALPPKVETILEVALTPIQKTYYKAIYERNTSFLFKGSKPSNAPSLMNVMMELRKCCNHPFLIKGAEDRILHEAASKDVTGDTSEDPVLRYRRILAEQLVQSSGKMVLLMKLLPKLQSGGHKILIFSQMVRVLDLLEELLKLYQYSYERLDGSTRSSTRAAAVDRFNMKSYNRFVMLLSTRAGGLGLNLTSADTVIIFDSDWNPQNDLQAMARAHRIGQTRAVRVYRLLTAKTYEMHMFHSASMKLGLDRAVLAHQRQQEGEQDVSTKKSKELQAKEIDELLKKGAYDVFRDDDDTEAKKFMETDIDQLLERSSRTITYDNMKPNMSSGLGSFSKASFVTSDSDGKDIDLDDPDFWAKAVGLEAPTTGTFDENILLEGEKRSRKQVQVFDPYAAFQEEEDTKKKKAEMKAKLEKEEKKRLKEEKKLKREEEREQKKKEKEESRLLKQKMQIAAIAAKKNKIKTKESKEVKIPITEDKVKERKIAKELMAKKTQRIEHRRAIRAIENEDPIVDRMRQGWDSNHRDNVIQATLSYGFGRFCKIRNECNLLSLPIQDIEVFVRAYIFQLGLQASVSMLRRNDIKINSIREKFPSNVDPVDSAWVMKSIVSAVKQYELCEMEESFIRIPKSLNDPTFVAHLCSGEAVSSLLRISFMMRLNRIIEDAAEEALTSLGAEERGKRGCYSVDISSLDVDLKTRHLTYEELNHSLGRRISNRSKIRHLSRWAPSPWWDRACDLALIIGTFLHGFGNFDNMQLDDSLPFAKKMKENGRQREFNSQYYDTLKNISRDSILDEIATVPEETQGLSKSSSSTKIELPSICRKIQYGLCQAVSEKGAIRHESTTMPNAKCLHFRLAEILSLIEATQDGTLIDNKLSSQGVAPCTDSNQNDIITTAHNQDNIERSPFQSSTFYAVRKKLQVVQRKESALQHLPSPHADFFYQNDIDVPDFFTPLGLLAMAYINLEIARKLSPIEWDKDGCQITRSTVSVSSQPNVPTISSVLKDDRKLRDSIFVALFCTGTLETDFFRKTAERLIGSPILELISEDELHIYVHDILLPHCVKLCLYSGNVEDGNEDKSAVSTQGRVEPITLSHAELPDPLLRLELHSLQSKENALALLRRIKLHRALSYIFNQEVDIRLLCQPGLEVVASVKDGLPIWWTSDFDWAMLCQAHDHGVLHSWMADEEDTIENHAHLRNSSSLRHHIRRFFVGDTDEQTACEWNPLIPRNVVQHCSETDICEFVDRQMTEFPSALLIEKRLALLCSKICSSMLQNSTSNDDSEWAFVDLPMIDHNRWRFEKKRNA